MTSGQRPINWRIFEILTITRVAAAAALLCAVGLLRSPSVTAQGGLSITSPAVNTVLTAGPDYATDVLGDAWDFNNVEDISHDPEQRRGWTGGPINGLTVNGRVGGTTAGVLGGQAGSSIAILERAYYGVINPGRNGARFPISTSTYSKIAYKMGSQRSDQIPRVYWFRNDLGHPSGEGSGWAGVIQPPSGDTIQVIDLSNPGFGDGVGWSGAAVRGLSLYPNNSAINYVANYDWVRLTTGDGHAAAATVTISWTGGSGNSTVQVFDSAGTPMTIAASTSATSMSWNYGVLPPGNYMFRVIRNGVSADRTFRINTPPTLQITDPDESGGEDFATAGLGNAWDMSDANDVRLEVPGNHLMNPSFSNGMFHATSDGVPVAHTGGGIPIGDPLVYVLANNGIINTSRYRYLTYRLQVDRAHSLERGSVARVFWGSTSGQPYNVTTTKDILVWDGMNSYTVDLGTLSATAEGGLEPNNATPWTAANVRYFRLDPHEFGEQITFHYDFVKLAAMDETVNNSFTIRFNGGDADGDPVVVSLYYDTDRNPASGLTPIVSNVPVGNGQYTWNTQGVPAGVYYIYAQASDGRDAHGTYSTGTLRVITATPVSDPLMSVDAPANGASTGQPFLVSGWAIDRGAPSGTGVDAVHVYGYRDGAGQAIFLGSAYGSPRADVGAAFGQRFTNSGFSVPIDFLRPDNYTIVVYAHSTVTGQWQARVIAINVVQGPLLAIDQPAPGSTHEQPFTISGWSIDTAAGSGTGVDTIHVWAFPSSGQSPIFAGMAQYGLSRADIGSIYGSRFTNSGYQLSIRGLPPGQYQLSVYSRSTATGTFNAVKQVNATVRNAPRMSLDQPAAGTRPQPFTLSGFALDYASSTGTGVDVIHVYAYPVGGGSPIFVGSPAYGQNRPDVAGVYGARFGPSGYSMVVSALPPGTYDIVAWARSTVSNAFDNWQLVRVTIP
jgi:hypothetical protein